MNIIDQSYYYDKRIEQWLNHDIKITQDIFSSLNNKKENTEMKTTLPAIKNVVFNNPLTIIIWEDGTKTYVKTSGEDTYDPEKGMALAIAKKAMGNKYEYFETIREWIKKDAKKKEKKNKKSAHTHPTEERVYIDLNCEEPSVIGNYEDMKKVLW